MRSGEGIKVVLEMPQDSAATSPTAEAVAAK
jgi:hypothetical protein